MGEAAAALWYTGPCSAEIRETPLPPLEDGWVEVETLFSALSRGTERLVWQGAVPASEYDRMRAPLQDGSFPFPVKYGYGCSGVVRVGPADLIGREVFCLHPHQERFRLPQQRVVLIPEQVPAARAVLAANMETALNAVWDARLAPGSEMAVVGLGLVGCLIAALLAHEADLVVRCADIDRSRFEIMRPLGVACMAPDALPDSHVTVFHTSASAAGLATAFDALAFEGEVIEASWYGAQPVPIPLGGAFHSRRLTLRATQVGAVAAPRRATMTRRERLERALAALADPRLDAFVTEEIGFRELPNALPRLLGEAPEGIATRIRYG